MSEHDHNPVIKMAHSGVNFLIFYELVTKLHEYWPQLARVIMELRHAHL